jgi:hypothetical protein
LPRSRRHRATELRYSLECVEGFFSEVGLPCSGVLRRLMRNCGRRGRSRNLMLAPNLLPKAVPHNGSRLLLGFIVRPHRRLVEGQPPLGYTSPRPRPALLSDPEVLTLAVLAQWPRFRSERDFWRFAWAHLRPYFPMLCSQGQLKAGASEPWNPSCASCSGPSPRSFRSLRLFTASWTPPSSRRS